MTSHVSLEPSEGRNARTRGTILFPQNSVLCVCPSACVYVCPYVHARAHHVHDWVCVSAFVSVCVCVCVCVGVVVRGVCVGVWVCFCCCGCVCVCVCVCVLVSVCVGFVCVCV